MLIQNSVTGSPGAEQGTGQGAWRREVPAIHTCTHSTGNLETTGHLNACLWAPGGNQNTWKSPMQHMKNMQTPNTQQRQDSNTSDYTKPHKKRFTADIHDAL